MRTINLACEADRTEILALYHVQIGREFCPWTEHYPSDEEITFDLSRDALYVMREEFGADDTAPENSRKGRIIAAVSLEEDPQVDALPCWTPEL